MGHCDMPHYFLELSVLIFVTLSDILTFINERNLVYLVMAFRHIIPSKNNIEIIEVKDYML